MWNRLRYKMAQFMQGRYGVDGLNRFLSILCLILIILQMFTRWALLWYLTLAVIIYMYYRMFSRDISKRYQEGQRFDAYAVKVKSWWQGLWWKVTHLKEYMATRSAERARNKDYHIYKCPRCGQKIRIPKGKGHIMVTCPKCRFEFHKKS